jgi:ubiquinone/menaquinone biosynthesis C-methylase UbiE
MEVNFLDPRSVVASLGLQSGMQVADLGVGRGFFALAIAEIVMPNGVVNAVDIQDSALEALRSAMNAHGVTNINLVKANLEVLGGSKITDTSQDMVFLANILFQSTNKSAILAEAFRMTKPGGSVVIIDWQKGAGGLGPPDTVRESSESMQQLVMQAGFVFERIFDTGKYHFGLLFKKP